MAIKVISYDLNKKGKDYAGLYKAIKSFPGYTNAMDSVWLVSTNKTTTGVMDVIKPYIDTNDYVLVHSWPTYRQGQLPKHVWDWIKKHE